MQFTRKMKAIILLAIAASFLIGVTAPLAVAQEGKTLTVGTGSGSAGQTVSLPITVSNPAGLGGVAFTLSYDPDIFEFQALTQATAGKSVSDGSQYIVPSSDPPEYDISQEDAGNNLFFQANGLNAGRVIVAAASAQALTSPALFNIDLKIKGGAGAYPVVISRTIITNPEAGYAEPTFIPALVGMPAMTPNAGGYFPTPVFPAAFVTGSITVHAEVKIADKPAQPVLVSPASPSILDTFTPVLEVGPYSDPNGAAHFLTHWQVSKSGTNPDFESDLVFDLESEKSLTSLKIPDLILERNKTYFWRAGFVDVVGDESVWSDFFSFKTPVESKDSDEEKYWITTFVDLDGNKVDDYLQIDMISVKTIDGNAQVGVKKSTGVISVEEVKPIDPKTLPAEGAPANMPYGLVSFKLTVTPGAEAEVIVYFSQAIPAGMKWYKYDPANGWYDLSPENAVFNEARTAVTLKLKDGGLGDADGVANGIIVDPSGPGGAPAPVAAAAGGGSSSGCFINTAKSNSIGNAGLLIFTLTALLGIAIMVPRRNKR